MIHFQIPTESVLFFSVFFTRLFRSGYSLESRIVAVVTVNAVLAHAINFPSFPREKRDGFACTKSQKAFSPRRRLRRAEGAGSWTTSYAPWMCTRSSCFLIILIHAQSISFGSLVSLFQAYKNYSCTTFDEQWNHFFETITAKNNKNGELNIDQMNASFALNGREKNWKKNSTHQPNDDRFHIDKSVRKRQVLHIRSELARGTNENEQKKTHWKYIW